MSDTAVITRPDETAARVAWLEAHYAGIGGSEAAAVCGLSRWATPLQKWLEKRRLVAPPDLSGNEAARLGIILEPHVADRLAEETRWTLTDPGRYTLQQGPESWLLCTVDRFVEPEVPDQPGRGVAEIKTTSAPPADLEAGEPADSVLETEWLVQLQHNLLVTGARWGVLAVLHVGLRKAFRWLAIPRNEAFISNVLYPRELEFWRMVQNGTPPAATTEDKDALAVLYPRHEAGKTVVLTPELCGMEPDELAAQLDAARAAKDAAEQVEQRLTMLLRAAATDAERIVTPGGRAWTYKAQAKAAAYGEWYKALPAEVKTQYPLPEPGIVRVLRASKTH